MVFVIGNMEDGSFEDVAREDGLRQWRGYSSRW